MKETFASRMALAVRESGKSLQEIADSAGTTKGQVSQWQTEGKVQPENIKAHVVESISGVLAIRPRWLLYGEKPMRPPGTGATPVSTSATDVDYVRVVDKGVEGDMGDGRINDDFPEVIRAVDYTQQYIRGLIGFVPPPGRLVLVTGRGDSMIPVINPGESLLVDTGVQSYDGDGIYLINTGNGQQIKALQDRGDAVYVVSANPLYPAFPFPTGGVVGGKLYIKNKIERFN